MHITEIITNLIIQGKYHEWIKYGSFYGHNCYKHNYSCLLNDKIKFAFYDANNNIIYVSMISKIYHDDLINIPIFEYVHYSHKI